MVQIRAYGFLANTNKKQALAAIRASLGQQLCEASEEKPEESAAEKILRLSGLDITRCPKCGGTLLCAELPVLKRPP